MCIFSFSHFVLVSYDLTWLSSKDKKSWMLDFGMFEEKKKKKLKCRFFSLVGPNLCSSEDLIDRTI